MPKQAFGFKIESVTHRFEADTMNPYLDKEYFGMRRYKLRARFLEGLGLATAPGYSAKINILKATVNFAPEGCFLE